jgi:hypothetical protein
MVENQATGPMSKPQGKTPAQASQHEQFRLPPLAAPKLSWLLE